MGRDITQCHPRLQEADAKLQEQCRAQGLNIKIGECFRSKEEQDALYAQGRTKPGSIVTNAPGSSYSSMHQWGVAFDFFKNVSGHEYDDISFFNRVGAIGKSLGLEWGGDWTSPVDKPHLQLADWGSTPAKLKQLYGNVDNFKKTWGEPKVNWKGTGVKICLRDRVAVLGVPGGEQVGTLNGGDMVETDGIVKDGYAHVGLPAIGVYGWVPADAVAEWKATGVMRAAANDINIRSAPGGTIRGQLAEGGLIEVDGRRDGEWIHVGIPELGIYGWMQNNLKEL